MSFRNSNVGNMIREDLEKTQGNRELVRCLLTSMTSAYMPILTLRRDIM